MLEIEIESPVVTRAENAGYYARKVQWIGVKGAPDRVFSRADRGTVYIEFKAPGEGPTTRQKNEHREMRAAGMEVYVCDNIEDALRILWLL